MSVVVQFVVKYGYPILFAAIFGRQIGLPVPALLFLHAAGALAAAGKLNFIAAFVLVVTGCVLADWAWYKAGRRWGERVLHFLHSLAPDPEAADRRARERFVWHGPPILVLDKFVPAIDAVAPPLAGTSGISRVRCLAPRNIRCQPLSRRLRWTGLFSVKNWDEWLSTLPPWEDSLQFSRSPRSAFMPSPKLVRWRRYTHRRLNPTEGGVPYELEYVYGSVPKILANSVSEAYVQSKPANVQLVFTNWGLFAQDTRNLTRNLTITYGLRCDYNGSPSSPNGTLPSTVDQGQ